MKLLQDWGFSANSWQGQRGEYWVLAQGILLIGLVLLPIYRPPGLTLPPAPRLYAIWGIAGLLGLAGSGLFLKGLLDLGRSLTPLPHPRDDGHLVESGVYTLVRHPVYSGVILITLAIAVLLLSLSHLIGAIACFLFFNAKANREETWLQQKYLGYANYQGRVKKLIPWLY
ncbi:methyltransferase family protein [Pantanalinema rosaneae CENA516]|uniref:methyltransferase family protein n=1 Tax=Pantanalinema rosaneae TaxID=1620701 RepID=UPI003D6DE11F